MLSYFDVVKAQFGGKDLLQVAQPFAVAIKTMEAELGGKIATAHQVAAAEYDAFHGFFGCNLYGTGGLVAEAFVFDTDGSVFLVSQEYNPILKNPYKAVEAHRDGKEFAVSDKEIALFRSVAKATGGRKALALERKKFMSDKLVPINNTYNIRMSRLAQSCEGQFLFGEDVESFARKWHRHNGNYFTVLLPDSDYQKSQQKPFARPMYMKYHALDSICLHENLNVWGIRPAQDLKKLGRDAEQSLLTISAADYVKAQKVDLSEYVLQGIESYHKSDETQLAAFGAKVRLYEKARALGADVVVDVRPSGSEVFYHLLGTALIPKDKVVEAKKIISTPPQLYA